jgi:protein TonB
MMHAIETETLYGKHLLHGWSLSVLLHLALVTAIALVMPNMTIVLEQEPFRWDVALVEPSVESAPQTSPEPASVVEPPPTPVHRAPVSPPRPEPVETVMPRVAPQQSAAMIHPEPPKVQPVQPAPPVPHLEPPPAKPVPPQETKKAEVREPEPIPPEPVKQELAQQETVKPEAVKEPVRETPAVEPAAPSYAYQTPAPQTVEPPPVLPRESAVEPAPQAFAADQAPPSAVPSKSLEPPATPTAPADAPPQIAKLAPQAQPPHAKADHRWVGESLWRRVAELKRYPASARLNGLEGRVVLKVVIRADGELADVSVAKSSGHAILDAAAMEAVKLACPLHMKQQIGPPQIVVSLPIVYSLAN